MAARIDLKMKTMRFLSGAGHTSLRYGRILKAYDSRHDNIWGRFTKLDTRARRYCCALDIGSGAGPIKTIVLISLAECPNYVNAGEIMHRLAGEKISLLRLRFR